MDEKKKVPKLRFPGFTDDWEQRKLGDILKYEQPGEYIVDSTNYDDSYNTPVLTAGQTFILGYTNETTGIKNASENNPVIIFDDFTTSSHFVDFSFKIKSSAMKLLTLIDDMDDIYCINNILENIDYVPVSHERHWISIFSKFDVIVPKDKDEQKKIGDYFRKLDHLITLHQRKLQHKKDFKKAMLQKMFPKKGEKYPEIRFPEFTDAWEQRKFGDVGSVAMCKRIFKGQTSDKGEVPFYKIGTFGGKPDAFISRELFNEYKTKYPYPNKGDILISASGSIGRTVEFTGKDEYFQDSNIVWLKHESEIDNNFLKVLYSVVEWSCEGSTIKRLYNDNFLKTEFMLPQIDEQIKLGTFFASLDNLITLHQRELENLKKLKKACLQKMFV